MELQPGRGAKKHATDPAVLGVELHLSNGFRSQNKKRAAPVGPLLAPRQQQQQQQGGHANSRAGHGHASGPGDAGSSPSRATGGGTAKQGCSAASKPVAGATAHGSHSQLVVKSGLPVASAGIGAGRLPRVFDPMLGSCSSTGAATPTAGASHPHNHHTLHHAPMRSVPINVGYRPPPTAPTKPFTTAAGSTNYPAWQVAQGSNGSGPPGTAPSTWGSSFWGASPSPSKPLVSVNSPVLKSHSGAARGAAADGAPVPRSRSASPGRPASPSVGADMLLPMPPMEPPLLAAAAGAGAARAAAASPGTPAQQGEGGHGGADAAAADSAGGAGDEEPWRPDLTVSREGGGDVDNGGGGGGGDGEAQQREAPGFSDDVMAELIVSMQAAAAGGGHAAAGTGGGHAAGASHGGGGYGPFDASRIAFANPVAGRLPRMNPQVLLAQWLPARPTARPPTLQLPGILVEIPVDLDALGQMKLERRPLRTPHTPMYVRRASMSTAQPPPMLGTDAGTPPAPSTPAGGGGPRGGAPSALDAPQPSATSAVITAAAAASQLPQHVVLNAAELSVSHPLAVGPPGAAEHGRAGRPGAGGDGAAAGAAEQPLGVEESTVGGVSAPSMQRPTSGEAGATVSVATAAAAAAATTACGAGGVRGDSLCVDQLINDIVDGLAASPTDAAPAPAASVATRGASGGRSSAAGAKATDPAEAAASADADFAASGPHEAAVCSGRASGHVIGAPMGAQSGRPGTPVPEPIDAACLLLSASPCLSTMSTAGSTRRSVSAAPSVANILEGDEDEEDEDEDGEDCEVSGEMDGEECDVDDDDGCSEDTSMGVAAVAPLAAAPRASKAKPAPKSDDPTERNDVTVGGVRILGGKYEVNHVVGEGAYGLVMKCTLSDGSGRSVAIKSFKIEDGDPDEEDVKRTARREVDLLRVLQHAHVVGLVDEFYVRDRVFIVMEFVPCNLLELLEAQPGGMDRDAVRLIMHQLCTAMAFIHSRSVVYRDIKPENVLVDETGCLKLCDFGFARYLNKPGERLTDYVATRWYRAPELLLGPPFQRGEERVQYMYGPEVDMWAVGCLMGELLDGEPLFPGDSDLDQMYRVQQVLGPLPPALQAMFDANPQNAGLYFYVKDRLTLGQRYEGKMDEAELDFMGGLLAMDPAKRLTGEQCLAHPYLAGLSVNEARSARLSLGSRGSAFAGTPTSGFPPNLGGFPPSPGGFPGPSGDGSHTRLSMSSGRGAGSSRGATSEQHASRSAARSPLPGPSPARDGEAGGAGTVADHPAEAMSGKDVATSSGDQQREPRAMEVALKGARSESRTTAAA
ncbi:hypothetical protein FOA52_002832 [Chlamydomonas sp. UWO 241]|nr:hypothetical protein FOA52_002832 [Chlamydomonas sp. UWO 241]